MERVEQPVNRPLKMKELEARTGVGREAIRFYIREGILPEPHKPRRNVAHYSEDHVRRLLAIRHLQEERDMSLSRIRSLLESSEFESVLGASALQGVERLLPALVDGVKPAADRLFDEVGAECGLTPEALEELCSSGVVTPVMRDGRQWISFRDSAILARWRDLREAGFSRERGYDLTMLHRYRAVADDLAAQEVDQFLNAFGDGVVPEEAARIAAQGIAMVNDILVQLHVKSILEALERRLRD